jgi:hypothetical protein
MDRRGERERRGEKNLREGQAGVEYISVSLDSDEKREKPGRRQRT